MVLNDFKSDVKEMAGEAGMKQSEVAYAMGMTRQDLECRIRWATVTKGYTLMCEALGYDLEVKYVLGEGGRVLNDFPREITSLITRTKSVREFIKESGITKSAIYSRAAHATLTRGMREIAGYFGYDVEVRYVKR